MFGVTVTAQSSGGILLVSDSDVPAGITRSVKRRLGQVSEVSDQKRASSEAGDAAFSKIGQRSGAGLIVHLSVGKPRELQVELRDAASGSVISSHEFPMQGRRLKQPSRALQELVAAARARLTPRGGSSAPPPTHSAETFDEEEPEASTPPAQQAEPAASAAAASEQPAGSVAGEQIMEDPELSARLAARPEEAEAGPRQGLSLQASVGIGPGVHALRVPTPSDAGAAGYGELDTGVAPVASLAAAAQLGLGQWLLRAEAQYRTFFAAAPYESPASNMNGAMTQSISSQLTSHSFVIGASPGYRFGGRDSVALMLLLGWTYRSLHASNGTLPGASLRGFVVRPALHIPFAEVFCLRLAPELIVVQSSETNAQGFMATQASGGLGWGAEAAVDVRLAKLLGAGLQYRRSRISATRSSGEPAIDEEWYVAVQAVLSL